MTTITATYSPEDNKLRLYASTRLDRETYDRVKAAGFIWAPKQELFVAPMWTPSREDLARELAGDIDDEDTSLVDRAEERADRFGDYSEKRTADAARAHAAVSAIADNIPLGQPILVGHHSERRARKDAERIQDGMRKAVRMWDTAGYWKARAAGALAHAKYKELPAVRARRIKTLEAEQRKNEREKKEAETMLEIWLSLETLDNDPEAQLTRARLIAGRTQAGRLGIVKQEGDRFGYWSAYDVLQPDETRYKACPSRTVADVLEVARRRYPARMAYSDRWLAHIANRLEYERAMLGEAGGLASDRHDIQPGGRVLIGREWYAVLRVNRKDGRVLSVRTNARYVQVRGIEEVADYRPPTAEDAEKAKAATRLAPLVNFPTDGCQEMTTAEWKRRPSDYKAARYQPATETTGAYRYRSSFVPGGSFRTAPVYLTDAKRIDPPAPSPTPAEPVHFAREIEPPPAPTPPTDTDKSEIVGSTEAAEDPETKLRRTWTEQGVPPEQQDAIVADVTAKAQPGAQVGPFTIPTREQIEATRVALKAGIQIVAVPQLFPTPPELAAEMVRLAVIKPGHRVLEPSAGTGAILRALPAGIETLAVELNLGLANALEHGRTDKRQTILQADFLQCHPGETADGFELGTFDRIVMNPPFRNGEDIRHIKHALRFLRPGGRLVALCAAGPRQRAQLEPLCFAWNDLPAGSFSEAGTDVNVALLVFDPPAPVDTAQRAEGARCCPLPATDSRVADLPLFNC